MRTTLLLLATGLVLAACGHMVATGSGTVQPDPGAATQAARCERYPTAAGCPAHGAHIP